MKKKHFLSRLFLCFLLAVLLIPAASTTAQAASSTAKPGKVTLTSAKSTAYNKATIYWKKTE